MKNVLFLLAVFSAVQLARAQEKLGKPFFTGDVNFTLGVNEDYEIGPDDDNGPLIVPAALFLRLGFGYEFKRRLALSVNGGFDYHWNYAVSAFPAYGAVKYNISEDQGDAFFVEMRYGKM